MAGGQVEGVGVDVGAADAAQSVGLEIVPHLLADGGGFLAGEEAEMLAGEDALHARGAVALAEGSLDEQGAGAAAGVMQAHTGPPGG